MLELTDFTLEAPLPLHWKRCYRSSLSGSNVGLGYSWRAHFHQNIERQALGKDSHQLVYTNEEGRRIAFGALQLPIILDSALISIYQASANTIIASTGIPPAQCG